jgi:hypothetical protein
VHVSLVLLLGAPPRAAPGREETDMWRARPAFGIGTCLAALLVAAAAGAESAAKKLLVGNTKTEILARYQGEPLPKPEKFLVLDFKVPADVVSVDKSMAARMHRRHGHREGDEAAEGATGADAGPEELARQVQESFSNALVRELQQAWLPAEAAPGTGSAAAPAPPHALLVRGEFTRIDEGNKTKRILIGFGKGASDVRAHVTVAMATERLPEPIVLVEFNMQSKSGKKPGAVPTMGAGAASMGAATAAGGAAAGAAGAIASGGAAAKTGEAAASVTGGGVLDRAASVQADASRMARDVAKQIVELLKSQQWASAPAAGGGS